MLCCAVHNFHDVVCNGCVSVRHSDGLQRPPVPGSCHDSQPGNVDGIFHSCKSLGLAAGRHLVGAGAILFREGTSELSPCVLGPLDSSTDFYSVII